MTVVDAVPAMGQKGPSYGQLAVGVLARTLSRDGVEGSRLEVEIVHVLVAPGGGETARLELSGGAVLELLSGGGAVDDGERVWEVGPGAVVAVDAGRPIRFDNRKGEAPMEWRATLIRQVPP